MSGMSLLRALDTQDKQETARILETMPSEVSIRDSEDRIALHYAAETMDLITFQKIYEQDPTLIDCQDKNGYTPLLMSVMGGRTDLVEYLLSKGANLNHVDKDGHSAVHWAVVCGQLETLSFILSKGADVETPDLLKASPLHYATATEEIANEVALSILHTLIRAGANPNCRDIDERTPILWTASNEVVIGNLEAMTSLKQAGGDLQVVDRDRLGVIHCAASHGYHEVVFICDNRLRTASHCAAAKGQMRMLKLLKQFNASFEIQNYRGDLPIHEAIQAGCKG
uniref:ANK_REP_REGION domain-containing protein n=1 Tax=Heterorhabditis bacteriophora TaxID=37862 RepID=A0A1I7XHH4_HETBA